MKTINDFRMSYLNQQKITMVTCYDYWSAKIIAQTSIDCILVGDSVSMVMHGYDTTVPATVSMMSLHIQAVVRGACGRFVIADMPFLSHRQGLKTAMRVVARLVQAGANAVKLEGAAGNCDFIQHCVESGIPVMGHLGLMPQSINQLGGFKLQGQSSQAEQRLLQDALALQQAGCFALVLECVPTKLAARITQQLTIPTIGIGAGPNTSGQVLVLHDLLGFNEDFAPKYLKKYLNGSSDIKNALNTYNEEVKALKYPAQQHSY